MGVAAKSGQALRFNLFEEEPPACGRQGQKGFPLQSLTILIPLS